MEEKTKKWKLSDKTVLQSLGLCLLIIAVILIVIFFLNGSTTIYNDGGEIATTESITCESSEVSYPFFAFDNSDRKQLKINVLLSNNKIDQLSLIYRLYYNSSSDINTSETLNHANMNKHFGISGLTADALGAKYSKLDDSLQLTLNSKAKEINEISAKYYLLDEAANYYNKETITKNYNSKGLDCTIRN